MKTFLSYRKVAKIALKTPVYTLLRFTNKLLSITWRYHATLPLNIS